MVGAGFRDCMRQDADYKRTGKYSQRAPKARLDRAAHEH